ncbi:MAG: hypothetical protein L3J26_11275, partial [Candidatus Polarisedimenticolaceae bacterium]|nr:hypothetical protein [Candidatus Polarisedimenticolaceae bacterium]
IARATYSSFFDLPPMPIYLLRGFYPFLTALNSDVDFLCCANALLSGNSKWHVFAHAKKVTL